MSLQKQLHGAYTSLRCCYVSKSRQLSSSQKYGNSLNASPQSSIPPSIVNQPFPSTPSSSISVRKGDRLVDGSSSNAASQIRTEKPAVDPSPEVKDARRITIHPPVLGSQRQSVKLLSLLKSELCKTSQPTTLIENAAEQVLKQGRGLKRRGAVIKKQFIETLCKTYSGRTVHDVTCDIAVLEQVGRKRKLDQSTKGLVARLTRSGLLRAPPDSPWHSELLEKRSTAELDRNQKRAKSSAVSGRSQKIVGKIPSGRSQHILSKDTPAKSKPKAMTDHKFSSKIEAPALTLSPLVRSGPTVPNLSHDLSRVLFNPGIYQLQDPRSRVFNFNPYLEKIMPVSEFDFKTLREYITSSRDEGLRSLALEHGKKYIGSSSSMTSTLAQFHFLLSRWRDLSTEALSKGFSDPLKTFTTITRSPSSVFLRYQDGVYAMDADKEYDSANILMSLGKSMEKLLTLPPQHYERYRKSSEVKVPEHERNAPEAYQYTCAGDFLMRAQLDAYDHRLPGTGTFDLKTRAVASIRHNINQHEEGVGYQIKSRFGDWESYEREYFDMMRSAFLKYSLQVRIGQMDGIFVAFHNVERIFGFQYVSLPEMDLALHGQQDTTLGDQEFKLSVVLLNRILNRVTEKFPKRSLRLHLETRDLPVGGIYMQIFAEPMDEASIEAIQNSKKKMIDDFEQRFLGAEESPDLQAANHPDAMSEQRDRSDSSSPDSPISKAADVQEPAEASEIAEEASPDRSIDAESETSSGKELLALTLRIQNKVNGKNVHRPEDLKGSDEWSVEFDLEEVAGTSTQAEAQYRASKSRRRTSFDNKGDNSAHNYYLKKLRELAECGAKWRKAQDEIDAGRQQVVLYEDK